ncbi:MAG: ATP-dependent carboxylate-amine ligase, partial [Methylococcaceae bacterium]|nr:ATP-dependent carboxylate-amine ligase [Methylococcaceae bacterium]
FAKVEMIITQQIDWPAWVLDRPQKGSIIHTGMPICSIIAGGKNERQVEGLLRMRQQQLIKLLI